MTFPQTIKSIGTNAFIDAGNMSGVVVLPPSLENVDRQAFDYTGISGLVLQSDCEINSFAFSARRQFGVCLYSRRKQSEPSEVIHLAGIMRFGQLLSLVRLKR